MGDERGKRMSEWWATTVSICLGITAVISLVSLITGIVKDTKKPTSDLEKRVELLEKQVEYEIKTRFADFDAKFGRDKARLDSIEEGNKVILQSLLAIMKHDIDGNNIDDLKKASKDLQDYMVNK